MTSSTETIERANRDHTTGVTTNVDTHNPDKTAAERDCEVCDLTAGSVARGQNFFVQWLVGTGKPYEAQSDREMLLLLPDTGAEIETSAGRRSVAGRSLCVLPAGRVKVWPENGAVAALLASSRPDLAPNAAINQAAYALHDDRLLPSEAGYSRSNGAGEVHVTAIDSITPPADKPRLKMFQTETLSINWVEYTDARNRTQLSPHSHTNFEQGSLAIHGHFVHHLRSPWGSNANLWREDQHLPAAPASMISVPVNVIHTTEGLGAGRHLLIDVFSPPRPDFISKGWVANAQDYVCQAAPGAAG
jgi:hypothetical protein